VYAFEPEVSVYLQFRGMSTPISVKVPDHVLRYLDKHAERAFRPDGTVIYRHPAAPGSLPALSLPWSQSPSRTV